jgi:hypothetical protein
MLQLRRERKESRGSGHYCETWRAGREVAEESNDVIRRIDEDEENKCWMISTRSRFHAPGVWKCMGQSRLVSVTHKRRRRVSYRRHYV